MEDSPPDNLQERFKLLVKQWRKDTFFLSSAFQIAEHPAYQEIIRMGEDALPLILQDLNANRGHWYAALSTITGASPVPEEARGRIKLMREAWVVWGRDNGYLD